VEHCGGTFCLQLSSLDARSSFFFNDTASTEIYTVLHSISHYNDPCLYAGLPYAFENNQIHVVCSLLGDFRRLFFICRRFGTLYPFHLHRRCEVPMKMERIKSSETSAYKKQTPGYHRKENIQHHEHGESLKSRIKYMWKWIFLTQKNLNTRGQSWRLLANPPRQLEASATRINQASLHCLLPTLYAKTISGNQIFA
jgi:hypothetical protein